MTNIYWIDCEEIKKKDEYQRFSMSELLDELPFILV